LATDRPANQVSLGEIAIAFLKLGASFTIRNGIMHSDDILLDSPAVQMSGHGDVDLSARNLEFHFEPKAAKGIPVLRLADIGAPFYVKGPWDKPSYGPDVRNLAKSIVQKLGDGATMPLDVLTRPGLSLKSILGTEKRSTKYRHAHEAPALACRNASCPHSARCGPLLADPVARNHHRRQLGRHLRAGADACAISSLYR